jgi:hypothetical protein
MESLIGVVRTVSIRNSTVHWPLLSCNIAKVAFSSNPSLVYEWYGSRMYYVTVKWIKLLSKKSLE